MVSFQVTDQTPQVRFLASLSDGRTVIQDDRPGQMHAWHRLKEFLAANRGLKITGLRLQGPGGREFTMPGNQPGYCFGFKGRMVFGGGESHSVGVGYYDGTTCLINWLRLPDLGASITEEQTPEVCGFKLIANLT